MTNNQIKETMTHIEIELLKKIAQGEIDSYKVEIFVMDCDAIKVNNIKINEYFKKNGSNMFNQSFMPFGIVN